MTSIKWIPNSLARSLIRKSNLLNGNALGSSINNDDFHPLSLAWLYGASFINIDIVFLS